MGEAVNSSTSACCALDCSPGVLGFAWDRVLCVDEVTSTPGCSQHRSTLTVLYKTLVELLGIHVVRKWLHGIWELFSKPCCIVSLKCHFFPSIFFFSEFFSGITNTSVLTAIVIIILVLVFAELFYSFPYLLISTLLREYWWNIQNLDVKGPAEMRSANSYDFWSWSSGPCFLCLALKAWLYFKTLSASVEVKQNNATEIFTLGILWLSFFMT